MSLNGTTWFVFKLLLMTLLIVLSNGTEIKVRNVNVGQNITYDCFVELNRDDTHIVWSQSEGSSEERQIAFASTNDGKSHYYQSPRPDPRFVVNYVNSSQNDTVNFQLNIMNVTKVDAGFFKCTFHDHSQGQLWIVYDTRVDSPDNTEDSNCTCVRDTKVKCDLYNLHNSVWILNSIIINGTRMKSFEESGTQASFSVTQDFLDPPQNTLITFNITINTTQSTMICSLPPQKDVSSIPTLTPQTSRGSLPTNTSLDTTFSSISSSPKQTTSAARTTGSLVSLTNTTTKEITTPLMSPKSSLTTSTLPASTLSTSVSEGKISLSTNYSTEVSSLSARQTFFLTQNVTSISSGEQEITTRAQPFTTLLTTEESVETNGTTPNLLSISSSSPMPHNQTSISALTEALTHSSFSWISSSLTLTSVEIKLSTYSLAKTKTSPISTLIAVITIVAGILGGVVIIVIIIVIRRKRKLIVLPSTMTPQKGKLGGMGNRLPSINTTIPDFTFIQNTITASHENIVVNVVSDPDYSIISDVSQGRNISTTDGYTMDGKSDNSHVDVASNPEPIFSDQGFVDNILYESSDALRGNSQTRSGIELVASAVQSGSKIHVHAVPDKFMYEDCDSRESRFCNVVATAKQSNNFSAGIVDNQYEEIGELRAWKEENCDEFPCTLSLREIKKTNLDTHKKC